MEEQVEQFFYFKSVNRVMTIEDALKMKDASVDARVREIMLNKRSRRTIKDAFEPGYQQNINEHITCPGEYKRRLKELGLVERGYDFKPIDETKLGGHINNDKFIQYAKEIGVDLSGEEMEAIKTGEYFKEGLCDNTIDADYKEDML